MRGFAMENIIKILISLAALGFILAATGTFFNLDLLGIPPEGYSRACNNLGVIAIALSLFFYSKLPS